ncbi:MAG TPA: PQQ-binding-like beta-propeller repeat protein [Bryobacteraceae bacterium]|nr:PQQ-binding-like beta-propeller repeat protein [Bryobacteraceae bacterium]
MEYQYEASDASVALSGSIYAAGVGSGPHITDRKVLESLSLTARYNSVSDRSAKATKELEVLAFDGKTGEARWRQTIPAKEIETFTRLGGSNLCDTALADGALYVHTTGKLYALAPTSKIILAPD